MSLIKKNKYCYKRDKSFSDYINYFNISQLDERLADKIWICDYFEKIINDYVEKII